MLMLMLVCVCASAKERMAGVAMVVHNFPNFVVTTALNAFDAHTNVHGWTHLIVQFVADS